MLQKVFVKATIDACSFVKLVAHSMDGNISLASHCHMPLELFESCAFAQGFTFYRCTLLKMINDSLRCHGRYYVCALSAMGILKARSHKIEIATHLLQTGSLLVSNCKIDVNGTMLYQCNLTVFYQSEASQKPVGSQSEASRLQISFLCE